MRKLILAGLLAAVLLPAAGCGQAVSSDTGFSREDLSMTVNGTQYRINDSIDTVIADLGPDYEYAEAMSCDYDGLDKTYTYDMAVFYTNPLAQGDLLSEIYTDAQNTRVSTSKGITVGATRDDVLNAYGNDCEDLGDLMIYRIPDERAYLCFEIEEDSGRVWAVYLTNQSV